MRALIFDYDGLMVDSERLAVEAVVAFLEGRGARADPSAMGHLFGGTGPEIDALWREFLGSLLGPVSDAVIAELDEVIFAAGRDTPLLPGVVALLDAARAAGWRVGLATGRERHRLEPELAGHGLAERFDAIVTAADVARGKPAPDIFLATASRLGVAPEDCIVLEDSVHGAEAALAAGMAAVVCPSVATDGCVFPAGARRVCTLEDLISDGTI